MSVKLWRVVRYAAEGHAGEYEDGREEMRGTRRECLAWLKRQRQGYLDRWIDEDGVEGFHESDDEGGGGWMLEVDEYAEIAQAGLCERLARNAASLRAMASGLKGVAPGIAEEAAKEADATEAALRKARGEE